MSEDLNELLEIKEDAVAADPSVPRVTLCARSCLVFGCLSLLSWAVSILPNSPTVAPGILDASLYEILARFGLIMSVPLALLTAIIALLRMRFSSRNFVGGRQVVIGIALAVLAGAVFFVTTCD